MSKGFFLNSTIVQEIYLWHSNTKENIVVFEPMARACSTLGSLLCPSDEKTAAEVSKILEAWCSSPEFQGLLSDAALVDGGISRELGRLSLSGFSGSESFVAGIPIDELLSAFSAMIRADLRVRESRSSARIDEFFIWQACFKKLTLHDLGLLILSACASKNVLSTFDRLLTIKEQPSNLIQIEPESLSADLCAQFLSGMRMLALSNFEAAEIAFKLVREKEPRSPSAYIALSLLHLLSGNLEQCLKGIEEAETKSDSGLLATLRQLHSALSGQDCIESSFEDPVSVAVNSFLCLRNRQYDRVLSLATKHFEKFPNDLVMRLFYAEALLGPIREELFNDPPLPGIADKELTSTLDQMEKLLSEAADSAFKESLATLKDAISINQSLIALMRRDFASAQQSAEAVLSHNPVCGEAKINFASAALATGELPKAMRSLDSLPADLKVAGLRLAAETYYHANSFEQSLEIWQKLVEQDQDRLWCLRYYCRMLEVNRFLRNSVGAQKCVDSLLTSFQNEPETLFALGYELWQMDRVDDSIRALRRAKDLAADNLKCWIAWELGRVLFDAEQNLSATDEYVSIADKSVDSAQAREFAVALFRAGLYPAAADRAKSLRLTNKEVIPGITEIETDYLVRQKNFAEAKVLLQELSAIRPQSVLNRMALVRICMTLGDEDQARSELEKIGQMKMSDEMQEEFQHFTSELDLLLT